MAHTKQIHVLQTTSIYNFYFTSEQEFSFTKKKLSIAFSVLIS